jgi:hypothetical protein
MYHSATDYYGTISNKLKKFNSIPETVNIQES